MTVTAAAPSPTPSTVTVLVVLTESVTVTVTVTGGRHGDSGWPRDWQARARAASLSEAEIRVRA